MKTQDSEQIMQEFNLTADSLASLPRGLPSELLTLLLFIAWLLAMTALAFLAALEGRK